MASKVIKAPEGSRSSPPPTSVPPRAGDAGESARADQIVAQAEDDRRRMLEQAEEEATAQLEDARQRGEADGRQSAAEWEGLAQAVQKQLATGLNRDALEAAVDAARQLVALEMKARPHAIVDVVKKALSSAKHQKEIYIRVHPRDAAVLRENKRELLDVLSRARDVDIREDALLQPGGCMVETEIGTVDADIGTQLDRLCAMLLGRTA